MKSEVSPEPERKEVGAGVFDEVSQLKFNKISILYCLVNWIYTSEHAGSFWPGSCISPSVGWHHTKLEIIKLYLIQHPRTNIMVNSLNALISFLVTNCWIYFELLKLIKINY